MTSSVTYLNLFIILLMSTDSVSKVCTLCNLLLDHDTGITPIQKPQRKFDVEFPVSRRKRPNSNVLCNPGQFFQVQQHFNVCNPLCSVFFCSLVMKTKRRVVMDTSSIYVRGEENLGEWKPRGLSLIDEHQSHLDKLERIQEVKRLLYTCMKWVHKFHYFQSVINGGMLSPKSQTRVPRVN